VDAPGLRPISRSIRSREKDSADQFRCFQRDDGRFGFVARVAGTNSLTRIRCLIGVILLLALVGPSSGQQKQPPAHPLDLNVANVKELEQVPGIGSKSAQAIVDFRHKSGRFRRVEDLLAIKGFSQRKLDKMRPYLEVTPPPPPHKSPQP
jgi:competence ComEA-like helix-hairpin-helix protein